MKYMFVIFAMFALAACSDGSKPSDSLASLPPTPENRATLFINTLLTHDAAAMRSITVDASQAADIWARFSDRMAKIQADPKGGTIAFRLVKCQLANEAGKTICIFRATRDGADLEVSFGIHVEDLRVTKALSGG